MSERPRPSAYDIRSQLTRLAAAALVVGVSLLVLWQAGVIFQPDAASVDDNVSVQPATVSIETPGSGARNVGLDEGNLAPDFEFSTFDGARKRLSDFRGRAVLLNFWATWCGPCRIELPDLEALLRDHAGDGLAVIAVNSGEKFGPANSYIKEIGVELTAWAYDPSGTISRRYAVPGLQGLPFSYFIDANGVVRRVIVGQMSPKVMEAGVAEMLVAVRLLPTRIVEMYQATWALPAEARDHVARPRRNRRAALARRGVEPHPACRHPSPSTERTDAATYLAGDLPLRQVHLQPFAQRRQLRVEGALDGRVIGDRRRRDEVDRVRR